MPIPATVQVVWGTEEPTRYWAQSYDDDDQRGMEAMQNRTYAVELEVVQARQAG